MSDFLFGALLGFLARYILDGVLALLELRRSSVDRRLVDEINKHFKSGD